MNLILFGYKASGKSYYAKKLAERASYAYIDTDHLIEDKCRMSVREINQKKGEEYFRKIEKEMIASLQGKKKSIISLGGGAILDPDNALLLAKMGTLVYLQLDKGLIKERLLKGPLPTFLDPKDPEGSFEKMYEKRKEIYESIPAIWLDANRKEEEVLEDLLSIIKENHGK